MKVLNIDKLFKMQVELDKAIEKKFPKQPGEDRFVKNIAALQVELAEMLQETRCFKYWSVDQEPRVFVPNGDAPCNNCNGQGYMDKNLPLKEWKFCNECDGCGYHFHNPILEEYADVISFTLTLGNDIGYKNFDELTMEEYLADEERVFGDINDLSYKFILINHIASSLVESKVHYDQMLFEVLGLGNLLGFTWEQVENAYLDKNKENYRRLKGDY